MAATTRANSNIGNSASTFPNPTPFGHTMMVGRSHTRRDPTLRRDGR